jgi:AcrR family transcriptional regulator
LTAAFTPTERARITGILLDTGRELFTTQGLRRTSLDDLAGPAGIARSSFYAFFDSKEALYLELMLRQLPSMGRRMAATLDEPGDTRAAIARYLRAAARVLQEDPLYRRLVTHPEELELVARRLDPARLNDVRDVLVRPLLEFLRRAQSAGRLVAAEPAVLLGVLQAVLLLPLHEREMGETYPAVLDLLIDVVAAGLTTRTEAPDERSHPRRDPARQPRLPSGGGGAAARLPAHDRAHRAEPDRAGPLG